MNPAIRISVLIKALNEEKNIAACIESVLRETAGIAVEIILADSLSNDRTVEIAQRYPVRIVQFVHRQDRGAAAAAQLAYQYAQGEYIYLIDGDMELASGYLNEALRQMDEHPDWAGVAGTLQDTRVNNMFDRHRVQTKPSAQAGEVAYLNGGGLYRKAAIDALGYFAHRYLPAFEEAELGLRLQQAGWRLMRLALPAVSHTGHDEKTAAMFVRMWRNGYARANGLLLKSAYRGGFLKPAILLNRFPLLLLSLFTLMLSAPLLPLLASLAGLGWLGLFILLLLKKRHLSDAAFSFFYWHYNLAGLIHGLCTPLPPAGQPIASICLSHHEQ